MFLFKPNHIPMILSGEKTQTRRNHKAFRARIGAIHQVRTELFGKPHCHIVFTRRWEEKVGDISEEDAKAEGGYSKEVYIEGLLEMHKGKLAPASVVKCYEFVLTKLCPTCGKECGIGKYQDWICLDCNKRVGDIPVLVEEAHCRLMGLPVETSSQPYDHRRG